MSIIRFAVKHSLLMNLLTVMLVGIGIYYTFTMQREAFPAVDFDIASVSTRYPGASPKEVELYITTPIEHELKSISEIEETTSISVEGISVLVIKIDPDLTESQKRKAFENIRRAVDRVSDLPEDLKDPPIVTEANTQNQPVLEVALSGNLPYEELRALADELTDRIEDISDVSTVEKKGFLDKEFWIEASPEKLRRYNLSLIDVVAALTTRNINLPGGAVKTKDGELLIRTIGEVKTAKEIGEIVLRANDANIAIKVKDIAEVKSTFSDEKESYRTNGIPSINLKVVKSASGDIISLVDEVKRKSHDFLATKNLGDTVQVSFVNDFSIFVRNRLGVLMNNGLFGIILVLASLLLFLSPGIAIVTAIGMPVAFLGSIAVMGMQGMTINLITMFALVIVLGMLVDDAIIVAENIWQHYERGASPVDAAIDGTSEVFWPVTATILTSIAAFSPLLMVSGIFGKFIRHMPIVVIIALTTSLLEAMMVLPSHALDAIRWHDRRKKRLEKSKKRRAVQARSNLIAKRAQWGEQINSIYEVWLTKILHRRWSFLSGIAALFICTLGYSFYAMPWVLFPPEGVESFFIQADLPVTSSLEQTSEKFRALEETVQNLPDNELLDTVTMLGKQQLDGNDPFTQRGSHVGQIQVFLTPEKDRDLLAREIIAKLRGPIEKTAAQQGFTRVIFERVRSGPPVGKPVAIRLKGDILDELVPVSKAIQTELTKVDGVFDVSENYRPGKEEILVKIDNHATSRALLTVSMVAQHIRAAYAGQVASHVRNGEDRIAIRVRYPKQERETLKSLDNITISNLQGNLIKLSDVTFIERSPGVNAIFHRDYKRTITITASIDDVKTTSETVNKSMLSYLSKLEKKYPGVIIEAGGEWEETGESLASLRNAFIAAMFFIFLILATQFSSLTQPFVVMTSIPFGLIGVIWAFAAHGIPLSFLGFIGIIGLTGVIVNDSIVLVDFLNKAIDRGMTPFDAAIYAGKRRFRAVWLTTLTTILGLLPLVYGIGGMDKFLQPAAIALGYGLMFGTVLVLFLVPAVYLIRLDMEILLRKLFLRNRQSPQA